MVKFILIYEIHDFKGFRIMKFFQEKEIIINDNIRDENILKRNRNNKIGKHCCKWKPRIIRDKYKWQFNAIVRFFPEDVKRWLMTRSNAISYFRLARNRSNSKTNWRSSNALERLSLFTIHACFSFRSIALTFQLRLKNRSLTFPSWFILSQGKHCLFRFNKV